jgi:hypothetical protein
MDLGDQLLPDIIGTVCFFFLNDDQKRAKMRDGQASSPRSRGSFEMKRNRLSARKTKREEERDQVEKKNSKASTRKFFPQQHSLGPRANGKIR